MHTLVVRHIPFEDLGHIRNALEQRGETIVYAELGEPIDLRGVRALVLMGGPMSANDRAPWVEAEIAAIRRAVESGIPVLGVCLGAQVLARALGATVFGNPVKEIGWYPVQWRAEAADDAVFGGLTGEEMVFHWHGETFSLPEGAVWLASSQRCAHQAYRYGEKTYGLQFHAEVTPSMIRDWCRQDANRGDVGELDGPIDADLYAQSLDRFAGRVFGRWADQYL